MQHDGTPIAAADRCKAGCFKFLRPIRPRQATEAAYSSSVFRLTNCTLGPDRSACSARRSHPCVSSSSSRLTSGLRVCPAIRAQSAAFLRKSSAFSGTGPPMPPADIKEDTSEGSEKNDSKPLLSQIGLLTGRRPPIEAAQITLIKSS
jgi:hypothetical protein